ncbi:5-oxoprolinase subunit B family protein [Primorskyibacter sp. 2E233]|uniref:5-oxoprolinase subunit B family protein n=1 Tax=Primorskyibacter sp. 2E233 TaxID=3413431 RepID=UPI003BF3B737
MTEPALQTPGFPRIDSVGLDGLLVRFGETLMEPANRAALAFKAEVERECPEGVEECSTSLVSCFVRFDPLAVNPTDLTARLARLVSARDWYDAALPEGRRFLSIPTVYGTELAPQLDEAAQAAGMSAAEAIQSLSSARVRVTAIGFAPGQPYLGTLPEAWDIPRQTALTPQVPVGALVVAIRQLVLFSVTTPTGWRHVGQTAVRLFQPESDRPFLLRPGDEVQFPSVTRERFETLRGDPLGGLTQEALP